VRPIDRSSRRVRPSVVELVSEATGGPEVQFAKALDDAD
jgi:hypothetical protein